jgi:hypothetical protein
MIWFLEMEYFYFYEFLSHFLLLRQYCFAEDCCIISHTFLQSLIFFMVCILPLSVERRCIPNHLHVHFLPMIVSYGFSFDDTTLIYLASNDPLQLSKQKNLCIWPPDPLQLPKKTFILPPFFFTTFQKTCIWPPIFLLLSNGSNLVMVI